MTQPRRSASPLPSWALLADCLTLGALVVGAAVPLTGGFRIQLAGMWLSVHEPWRAVVVALVSAAIRHAFVVRPPFPLSFGRPIRHAVSKLRFLDAAILCVSAIFVYGLVTRSMVFGSRAGHWVYPIIQGTTPEAIVVALLFALGVPLAFEWSARRVDRSALTVVAVWMILGFVFQVAVRNLYPIPMGRIVESEGCNSFFSATLHHAPFDVIANYDTIAPTLPLHAQANMPGKLFIYYFLELFSRRPETLAFGVIALSNVASALLFLVARRLFHSGRVATLAMVLSLIFPAKVAFLPLLNTVTPLFALASFWVWTVYLDKRQDRFLWLLGGSLYLLLFVDPLTFVLGIVFLGVMAERLARSELARSRLWRSAVIPVAGFLIVHVLMRLTVQFDIGSVFVSLLKAAADFNQTAGRPYDEWVVQNLKEFFLGAGLAPSLLTLLSLYGGWRAATREGRRERAGRVLWAYLAAPGSAFVASLVLCVLMVDLAGINRGEVTRLWIFLGVFLQLACAHALVTRFGETTTRVSLAVVIVQTTLTASMVGFVLC